MTIHPPHSARPPRPPGLNWPTLHRGRLIRRYKRFLADVVLDTGEAVCAHCPNSGRMTGCAEPGRRVYLSRHDSPKRKLKYTWEMIDMPGSLVGVNTLLPNRLVAAAVRSDRIPALAGYHDVRGEVRTSPHTRLDLLLAAPQRRRCYIEIKNCTLVESGVAKFPDAPTTRGVKHLEALIRLSGDGHRCGIFFLIQRMDARSFSPASHIDPAYTAALRKAADHGVEIFAYDTVIDLQRISLGKPVPVRLTAD